MDVFLSYAAADRRMADRLASDLAKKGLSVWTDREQLRPGANIVESITKAIQGTSNFIVLVSSKTANSPWLSSELAVALASKGERPGRRIIPAIVEAGTELPPFLRTFQALDLSTEDSYKKNLPLLVDSLVQREELADLASSQGPLPSPEILREYERVIPGFAEKIFQLTEREAVHRRSVERELLVQHRIGYAAMGSLLGTLVVVGLALSGVLESRDLVWFSSGSISGIIFSVIASLAAGRLRSKGREP